MLNSDKLFLSQRLGLLADAFAVNCLAVQENASDLSSTNTQQQKVDRGKAEYALAVILTRKLTRAMTHKRLRGLMTKHQRVQIDPVSMRAMFCVNDNCSAGRAKSETPARTSPH